MTITLENIRALAEKYDIEEDDVFKLLKEGFTLEEAEEIIIDGDI